MKLSRLFIFFLLFFITSVINAQSVKDNFNNLKFKHYTTKQGLSQGSVIDIFQDNTGYLWFGTREGLNKFDGTKFTSFRHNSEDSTSISDSWITSIFHDSRENIWVGTKKGLNKYNPKLESIKIYLVCFHAIQLKTSQVNNFQI